MKFTSVAYAAVSVIAMLASGPAITACATVHAQANDKPAAPAGISGWTETGSYTKNALLAGEGIATVQAAGGPSHQVYRGLLSVPVQLAAQGWVHVGDPDSAAGYIVDAYQGIINSKKKMFLLTTPTGSTYQYVHTLVPGEIYNNSFDAISPDQRWMIAGEFGAMTHLQIYPTPYFNTASKTGGTLELSGYIKLSTPVNNIQGCDFVTPTVMICTSDDSSQTDYSNKFPLLEVSLPAPLNGNTMTGTVTDLGSLPQQSNCSGAFEPEGIDYDTSTGTLQVEITQPGACKAITNVYEYRRTSLDLS